MIINQANLRGMFEDFKAIYTVESTKAPSFDRAPYVLPLVDNVKDFNLTFLLNYPTIHDWVGDKAIQQVMDGNQWMASSRKKESTIAVDRYDIQFDRLGLVRPQIAKMGSETANYPSRAFAAAIEAGAGVFSIIDDKGSPLCKPSDGKTYDGQNLFYASHKLGKNTVNNLGSTAWSIAGAISTRNTMRAWTGANNLLLNVEPDTIFAGRGIVDTIRADVENDWVSGSADRTTNPIKGAFKVEYLPWLDGTRHDWYMGDTSRGQEKPVLELVSEPLHFTAMEFPYAEPVWNRAEFQYSIEGFVQTVVGFPWLIYANRVA